MFMAAEALLLTMSVTPASHRGVIAAFGEHFVKTGIVPKEDGRSLAQAHEQRVAAECDPSTRVPAQEATALLHTARAFVAKLVPLIEAKGGDPHG